MYVIHPEAPAEEPAEESPKASSKGGKDKPAAPAKPSDVIIGTIEIRPIQVAYATPDAVEIKAGLEDEELIVADIQQEMEEKTKVEVTEVQEYTF